ncbi:hypothetical protein [Rhodococcus gannanensis]|uniref:Uncharacterized protein n=1 Tax=Rhodococcus gannanensis TaxID=1960308 RepID=A0ABW4P2X0_9NOCA
MKFADTYVSREHRFSIGVEEDSGRKFVSIPVSSRAVDYEYYEIGEVEYGRFVRNPLDALDFVTECRRRINDDRLIIKPGWNRGTPV